MRVVTSVLVCLLLGFPLGSHGDDVSPTRLQVSATVLPRVTLDSTQGPITITTADVARGYVDVARRLALRTNAPGRVVLRFQPLTGYTQAVDVDGFGPTLRLADTEVEIVPPGTGALELSYRLWLEDGLSPGEYPWPVHVAAAVR